jgi:hypothetical protein
MTQTLLENGADVSVMGNYNGQLPRSLLTVAVEQNDINVVKVILETGVDVNVSSVGYYGCTKYGSRVRHLSPHMAPILVTF